MTAGSVPCSARATWKGAPPVLTAGWVNPKPYIRQRDGLQALQERNRAEQKSERAWSECMRHFRDITQAVLQQRHHGGRRVKQLQPPARRRLSQERDRKRGLQHSKAWSRSPTRRTTFKAPASRDTPLRLALEGRTFGDRAVEQIGFSHLEKVESGRPPSAPCESGPAPSGSWPAASCDKALGTDGAEGPDVESGRASLPKEEPGMWRNALASSCGVPGDRGPGCDPPKAQGGFDSPTAAVTSGVSLRSESARAAGTGPQGSPLGLHLGPAVDKIGGAPATTAPASAPMPEHSHLLCQEAHGSEVLSTAAGLRIQSPAPTKSELPLCTAGLSHQSPQYTPNPDAAPESAQESPTISDSMGGLKGALHAGAPLLSPETAIRTLREASWARGPPQAEQAGADGPDQPCAAAKQQSNEDPSIADQHTGIGEEPGQPTAASPTCSTTPEIGRLTHSVDREQEGLGTPWQHGDRCPSPRTCIPTTSEGPALEPSLSKVNTEVKSCADPEGPTLGPNSSCKRGDGACEDTSRQQQDEHPLPDAKEHALSGKAGAGSAAAGPSLPVSGVDSRAQHAGVAHPRDTKCRSSPEPAGSLGVQIAALILHEDADTDALIHAFTSVAVAAQRDPASPGKQRGCLPEPGNRPQGPPQPCGIVPAAAREETDCCLLGAFHQVHGLSNAALEWDALGNKAEDAAAKEVCETQPLSGVEACGVTGGPALMLRQVFGIAEPNSASLREVCTLTQEDAAGQDARTPEMPVTSPASTFVQANPQSPISSPSPAGRRGESPERPPSTTDNSLVEAPSSCEDPVEPLPTCPPDQTQKQEPRDGSNSYLVSEGFCVEAEEMRLALRAGGPPECGFPGEAPSMSALHLGSEVCGTGPGCPFWRGHGLQEGQQAGYTPSQELHKLSREPMRIEAHVATEPCGSSETPEEPLRVALRTSSPAEAPPNQALASTGRTPADALDTQGNGPDSTQLDQQALEDSFLKSPSCTGVYTCGTSGTELPEIDFETQEVVREVMGAGNFYAARYCLDAAAQEDMKEGGGSAEVAGSEEVVHEEVRGVEPACIASAYLLSPACEPTLSAEALDFDEGAPSDGSWEKEFVVPVRGSLAEPDTWPSHIAESPVSDTCVVNAQSEAVGCGLDMKIDDLHAAWDLVDATSPPSPVSSASTTESSCSVVIGASFFDGLLSSEYTHLWNQTSSPSLKEEPLCHGGPCTSEEVGEAFCETVGREVERGSSPPGTDSSDTITSTCVHDPEDHSDGVEAPATKLQASLGSPPQDQQECEVCESEHMDERAGVTQGQAGALPDIAYSWIQPESEAYKNGHAGTSTTSIGKLHLHPCLGGALPLQCDMAPKQESPQCSLQCQVDGIAAVTEPALECNARQVLPPNSPKGSLASGATTPAEAAEATNHGEMLANEEAVTSLPRPDLGQHATAQLRGDQSPCPRAAVECLDSASYLAKCTATVTQSTHAPSSGSGIVAGTEADLCGTMEMEWALPSGPVERPSPQEIAPGPAPAHSMPLPIEAHLQNGQPLHGEASQRSFRLTPMEGFAHLDILQPSDSCCQPDGQSSPDRTSQVGPKALPTIVGPSGEAEAGESSATPASVAEERQPSDNLVNRVMLPGWEGSLHDLPPVPHPYHNDAGFPGEADAQGDLVNALGWCQDDEKIQEGWEAGEDMDFSGVSTATMEDPSPVETDAAWLEAYIERAMALYLSRQGGRPWDHIPLGAPASLLR